MLNAKARFTDKMPALSKRLEAAEDMALAHAAQDIEVIIKIGGRTPVKKGIMKAAVRHFRVKKAHYRVESPEEYSATQELGQRRGSAPFRNYTTSGTGKGWFSGAVRSVTRRAVQYFLEANRSVGLK
jgi:hypothetical protein